MNFVASERHGNPIRILLAYWGRRGGLTPFTLAAMRSAQENPGIRPVVSVSRQNERFAEFLAFGDDLEAIDTHATSLGSVGRLYRVPAIVEQLTDRIRRDRIEVVISLMSHVWTPLIAPSLKHVGVRYATVVHDYSRHPGDPHGYVLRWMLRDTRSADVILTLSQTVADAVEASYRAPKVPVVRLFHPDLFARAGMPRRAPGGRPFRIVIFGRLLPYKGLDLLVEAVARVRAQGRTVDLGVFGEGSIDQVGPQLKALGAEVINRWLSDEEIDDLLSRYDAVALSHKEASQSGIAAAAAGRGLPAIATPVGGLREQVIDGQTGVLASRVDAAAYAEAIIRLMDNPGLYEAITTRLAAGRDSRSMSSFVAAAVAAAIDAPVR